MTNLLKDEFTKKMMAYESFKKAEKRRQIIWENKRESYDYIDFFLDCKMKTKKRKGIK